MAVSLILLATGTYSITGVFNKAFDKTLSPGESYERNITIRKFYNLTIRFQKETTTSSYLSFDNNQTVVELKDSSGNILFKGTGVTNARMYFLAERSQLLSIKTVSAYNLGKYEDVSDQPVDISYSGTTAYITVKVKYKPSSISGFVIDELTSQPVEGVEVLAFSNSADPNADYPLVQNESNSNGRYILYFHLNASKALDIYVKDYNTV
ncbi:MAG: hypothetical protein ACTSV6_04635 [Candidatus Heimdallarchaeota archaeon]